MALARRGQRIRFQETSRDVVHSFWVPEMLFKRDVFPGSIHNSFEVTLDREGRFVSCNPALKARTLVEQRA